MKRSGVVIFVSSSEEVSALEKILRKTQEDQPTIIASTPEAAVKLSESRIDFVDSDVFYPATSQIKSWQNRLLKLCQTWHLHPRLKNLLTLNSINLAQVCELGIHIYLGEIGHSLLTAENLIRKLQPQKIYVADDFSESPFRRYQTESFTLEPLTVKLMSEKLEIETVGLSRPLSSSPRILLILRQLASSFLSDIRHIFSSYQPPSDTDFIFVGNHYQLINLLPTLTAAKDKIKFIVTGKASPEIVRQVADQNIAFVPFEKFSIGSHRAFDFLKYLVYWLTAKPLLKKIFSAVDPLIWKLIEPKLFWYFIQEFPETARLIRAAGILLSKSPKAVITMATSDHFSRAIALAAISKQIPVVELQHGLYLTDCEYPFRSNDYFLVWSDAQRKQLHHKNNHIHKYPIAGYPWFDQYRNIKTLKSQKNKTLNILILANFPRDLDDDRFSVSQSPFQFMTTVFTAISRLNVSPKVVFRPHPSCLAKWVILLSKQFKVSLRYDDRSIPLVQSIFDSDLVIANFTTAIVDTMLVGRPIFLYTFHDSLKSRVENFDATKLGAWKTFQSTDDLKVLIHKITNDKKFADKMLNSQKMFLRKHVMVKIDSGANQIIKFLENLAK